MGGHTVGLGIEIVICLLKFNLFDMSNDYIQKTFN